MKLTPTPPIFPAVGEDGKIRESHLPDRLSESALTEKIESTGGGGVAPHIGPNGNWWVGETDTGTPAQGPPGTGGGGGVNLVEIAKALGQYRGTGFPNGAVSAPVGSIYTDTNATAGAIRWIKTTGTGNTGWEVEYGDTGKRLLPKSLYATGADQYVVDNFSVWIRRYNSTIYLGGYFLLTEQQNNVVQVPEGFEFHGQGIVLSGSNTAGGNVGAMNTSGGILKYVQPQVAGSYLITPVAVPAVSSWPISLPGTPI